MPVQTQYRSALVGITYMALYPWNNGAGPYDATTIHALNGLKMMSVGLNPTVVDMKGGESLYALEHVEVGRKVEIKIGAFGVNLQTYNLIMGDSFSVSQAVPGNETSILSPTYTDRSDYFRLVGRTNLGNGRVQVVIPRCKFSGSLQWDFKADEAWVPEATVEATFDQTYVRQRDGGVGGIYEFFMGQGSQGTFTYPS